MPTRIETTRIDQNDPTRERQRQIGEENRARAAEEARARAEARAARPAKVPPPAPPTLGALRERAAAAAQDLAAVQAVLAEKEAERAKLAKHAAGPAGNARILARDQLEDVERAIAGLEQQLARAQATERAEEQALNRAEFELSLVQRRRAAFVPLSEADAAQFVAFLDRVVPHLEGLISRTPIGDYYALIKRDEASIARLIGQPPAELHMPATPPEVELT